jgi:hypothetical protein
MLLGGFLTASAAVDFNRDIRPLLSDRCYKCHGPDAKIRKAKLRLDSGSAIRTTRTDAGPLVSPGRPDASELLHRITTDDPDDLMPPPESGLKLSPAERALIRQWIADGANHQDHWAFQTPRKQTVPARHNPIDYFIRRRLTVEGLNPSPAADRATIIRRVSFDVTGLPPTAAEVDRFVRSTDPQAYAKLVRRLLASERYGERMAVDWLDVARWADTSGLQYDIPRSTWLYRDWVINAFNSNLPYHDFIAHQLAGDLLPNATTNQLVATGFNRIHPTTSEDGTIAEEYRVHYVADRTATMGTAFLGLTLECARCHDHKFDPLSQREFYSLFGFFNQMTEDGQALGGTNYTPPGLPIPTAREQNYIRGLYEEYVRLNRQMSEPDPSLVSAQRTWEKTVRTIWTTRHPATMGTQSRVPLVQNSDDSISFSGRPAAKDTYGFDITSNDGQPVTAIRLEALRDQRLPRGGPGLAQNGNAILTGVRIQIRRPDQAPDILVIKRATASYSQPGFPVADAIGSDSQTGWAFGSPQPADHSAVFELAAPVTLEPGEILNITLYFHGPYPGHSIGKLRLSTTDAAQPCDADPSGFLHRYSQKPESNRTPTEQNELATRYRVTEVPRYRAMSARIAAIVKEQEQASKRIAVAMIMQDNQRRRTFVLERGRYDRPREEVRIGTPQFLPAMPPGSPPNRLGLARWLAVPEHPLTARVFVNRLWQQFFGTGLVATANDFGVQGASPSHPELLDWLAVDFRENGWDIKRLIERIVSSATYLQSSATSPARREKDPENRLLARGPRRRLGAEMIRDNALAIAGLLVEKIGGPSVKPYQPAGLWKQLTNREKYQQVYRADTGDGLYRRSVYTYWKRAAHHPAMSAFDAPAREICSVTRERTTTPQQALVLLHDPQFIEAARHLAQRMLSETTFGKTPAGRIRHAFKLATSRLPNARELELLLSFHRSEAARLTPAETDRLLAVGESPVPAATDQTELAAYTMVARMILNLSEVITLN